MIRFGCAGCGMPLSAPEERAGTPLRCPRCRHVTHAPAAPVVLLAEDDDEPLPVAELAPAAPRAPSPARRATMLLAETAGFVLRVVFFGIAPVVYALFCVITNQNILLVLMLLVFGLTGVISNPGRILAWFPWLDKVPLVGDGLRILERLHAFYQKNPARPFVFYLFYPLTCPVCLPFSRGVRRELVQYLAIIGTVIGILFLDAALGYGSTWPPYLGFGDALATFMARLVFTVPLVLCIFVPVATTGMSYSIEGKRWRLRFLSVLGLVVALYTVSHFRATTDRGISSYSSTLLGKRMRSADFRRALRERTEMFLTFHVRRPRDPAAELAVDPALTEKYQAVVANLAVEDEARAFQVLTVPGGDGAPCWLGVKLCYANSHSTPPLLIGLVSPDGAFHATWEGVPEAVRARFEVADPASLRSFDPALRQIGRAALIDDL